MQFRVYGTPSSNRAELYAVLRALRLCKPVKELHIQCDSETSMKMVFKAASGKHIKHNTPNRDLPDHALRSGDEMAPRSTWLQDRVA